MTIRFGTLFSDAAALFRSERELVLTLAGVFLFVPGLALGLLVPDAVLPEQMTPEQMQGILMAYVRDNIFWLAPIALVQEFGALVLLRLFLQPGGATVAQVLRTALVAFPAYLLVAIVGGLAAMLGFFALVVPGLYVLGRMFVTGAVLAAEPRRGALHAIERGVGLSAGHGWILASVWLSVMAATYLAGSVFGGSGAGTAVSGAAQIVDLAMRIVVAAISTALSVAMVLLRVAAYRALTSPKRGI